MVARGVTSCSPLHEGDALRAGWVVRSGFILLAFTLVPLFARAPEEPSQEGVIRITVNLVQVDAVVTDSKGHQVTNLQAADFEILEDGRQQAITNFSYISVASPAGVKTHAKTPPLATSLSAVAPVRLRPEQVRRTIAIVVDDLHISFENIPYVRQALKKFVDEDVQPGDLVAILRTSGDLGARQQFTNDKRLLYAAIQRVRYYLRIPFQMPDEATGSGDFTHRQTDELAAVRKDLDATERREREFRQEATMAGTIDALDYVVTGLRDLSGRKAAVLVTDQIPVVGEEAIVYQRLRELVELANRSSAVVYTIDARGLPTLEPDASQQLWANPASRALDYFESQWPTAYLAKETGGLFVHDTNDLAGGMREVMDDLSGYYLIGYKPPADTFKAGQNERGYHRLQVKVKVPGLHVRSRTGFYGIPDEKTRPVYRTRDEQLRAAVTSPFSTAGVHVDLASQFLNEGGKESIARLWLHIDVRDLTFQDAPDGTKKGAVDVLALTFGDNGAVVNSMDRTFTGAFQPSQLDALHTNGVNDRVDMPIKDPGGYQLRVAVRDTASQRVGSASEFIEIPDVRRGRLTLSGLLLNAGALGDKGPAVRRLQAGDRASYELEIYNARRDKAGQASNLESRIQILRDGHLESTQNPGGIGQVPWDSRRLVMSGELTLSPDMVPGDYDLQVTVIDKLAPPRHSVASQWIDFEIVP